MTDGAAASAKALRSKTITLLELAEDVVLKTVQDADNHFKDLGLTPPATTKKIGGQVCVCVQGAFQKPPGVYVCVCGKALASYYFHVIKPFINRSAS